VASPCPTPYARFRAGGVTYYGMPAAKPRTRVGMAVSRWRDSFVLEDMGDACTHVVHDYAPDIIHVHGTEGPFGLIAGRSHVPVIISLQGLLTVYERSFFRGMTSREIASLTSTRSFVLGWSAIHGYWRCVKMAAREREILRVNRSFMGRTEWDRAVLWAVNPAATYYRCDEILRPPFYGAAWHGGAPESRTVFCTSSTITGKGAECLIEALGLLHKAGYPDVRLRIAGIPQEGPGYEFYAARARKHGVMESITWLGRLDADEIVAELLNGRVFAYPSHVDNSPNALCEALLVGAPSVASYVGGIPSLVSDGHDGLLSPDGDPFALADRIRHLLDNPSLAAEIGHRARERALSRHDPETIVASLLKAYGEVQSLWNRVEGASPPTSSVSPSRTPPQHRPNRSDEASVARSVLD